MQKFIVIGAVLLSLLLSGCATMVTKQEEFPGMYTEKPKSLLIMPPINLSTAAEAKDYYSTTIEMPVAFHGYYTFPYELTTEVLKQQGVYDSELVYDLPLNKFKEYFGADAVLFTKIQQWDTSYMVLASNLTVSIDTEIKSTTTGETLWAYNGTIVVDLSGSNNSGGGAAGLLIQALATAINTAAADYTDYAKMANNIALSSLPYGPYHPQYGKDGAMQFPQQKVAPKEEQTAHQESSKSKL